MLSVREQRRDPVRRPAPGIQRWSFSAMAMDVVLAGPLSAGTRSFAAAARAVEEVFREADARFSRFRPDSELSRVNVAAGRWQAVSAMFAELLRRSLDAARATEGLFDPTVLPALIAAGYDRDYDELLRKRPRPPFAARAAARWHDVQLDGRMLFLPEGAALDFGGIAKGWAVDRAIERTSGLRWSMVDAGGDLAIAGRPPRPVPITVADPWEPAAELAQLGLDGGALATSSVVGRSWAPGQHHLIDPRTWRPARTPVVQSTVWAPTCVEAEVLAKWSLLRGPRSLREVPGIMVLDDGTIATSMPGAEVGTSC